MRPRNVMAAACALWGIKDADICHAPDIDTISRFVREGCLASMHWMYPCLDEAEVRPDAGIMTADGYYFCQSE